MKAQEADRIYAEFLENESSIGSSNSVTSTGLSSDDHLSISNSDSNDSYDSYIREAKPIIKGAKEEDEKVGETETADSSSQFLIDNQSPLLFKKQQQQQLSPSMVLALGEFKQLQSRPSKLFGEKVGSWLRTINGSKIGRKFETEGKRAEVVKLKRGISIFEEIEGSSSNGGRVFKRAK